MNTGICILAGGLSTRMGRDKGRMRLGKRTLLGHVRRLALSAGLDVRVIRRDIVPRCGPLGGVYTGLKTSARDSEVFLSCDMPFVKLALVRRLIRARPPTFVEGGFPFMLSAADVQVVEAEIRNGRFSLQNLAQRLKAKRLRVSGREAHQLLNLNTPADWREARRRLPELPL
ncbi:MAG TPA: molybdenum cofactor guanylyltransferase [Candidatus Binatia bacterium]|nr:molybdenum cofactor guanylyltransferase [Candidatus Binatia bacterium]